MQQVDGPLGKSGAGFIKRAPDEFCGRISAGKKAFQIIEDGVTIVIIVRVRISEPRVDAIAPCTWAVSFRGFACRKEAGPLHYAEFNVISGAREVEQQKEKRDVPCP